MNYLIRISYYISICYIKYRIGEQAHHGEKRCVAEYRGHDGPDRRSKRWSPEPQTNELKNSEVAAAGVLSSRIGSRHKRHPPPWKLAAVASAYLRAAQAYMLISMPTGTSTIFGAFQAILALHFNPDGFRPAY